MQQAKKQSDLVVIGPSNAFNRSARKSFWLQYADDIVNVSRATHINQTADLWADFKSDGRLNEEVAIIVDGSVQRPIKSVKFGGQIIIAEPPSQALIYEAMGFAVKIAQSKAAKFRDQGFYEDSFVVFADNEVALDPRIFTSKSGLEMLQKSAANRDQNTFLTLSNFQPYARKQEAMRAPTGIVRMAYAATKRKYGNQLSLRFRYYRGTGTGPGAGGSLPMRKTGAKKVWSEIENRPYMYPAFNIGPPGAFNSGATRIQKTKSQAAKLKRLGL